jgi:hypothetical protein
MTKDPHLKLKLDSEMIKIILNLKFDYKIYSNLSYHVPSKSFKYF